MPKPGWLTLLLKIIGFAGKVAGDANEAFPNQGHGNSLGRVNAPAKLADLAAEKKRRKTPVLPADYRERVKRRRAEQDAE